MLFDSVQIKSINTITVNLKDIEILVQDRIIMLQFFNKKCENRAITSYTHENMHIVYSVRIRCHTDIKFIIL